MGAGGLPRRGRDRCSARCRGFHCCPTRSGRGPPPFAVDRFDCFELAMMIASGVFVWRRSSALAVTAMCLGTLMFADAWFNIFSATGAVATLRSSWPAESYRSPFTPSTPPIMKSIAGPGSRSLSSLATLSTRSHGTAVRLIDEAGVELSVDGCWVEVGDDDEFGAAGPVGSTTSDFRKAPTTDCSRRFLYHPAGDRVDLVLLPRVPFQVIDDRHVVRHPRPVEVVGTGWPWPSRSRPTR